MLELSIKSIRENQLQIEEVKQEVQELKQIQEKAISELQSLPLKEEKLPELSTKDKIRLLVNRVCSATGVVSYPKNVTILNESKLS